jgi:hypothetical protein
MKHRIIVWDEQMARKTIVRMGFEGLFKWAYRNPGMKRTTIIVKTEDGREIELSEYLKQLQASGWKPSREEIEEWRRKCSRY